MPRVTLTWRPRAVLAPDGGTGAPRWEPPAALLRRLRDGGLLVCDHDGIERVEYPGDGTLRLALCGGGAVAFRLADAGTARNAGAARQKTDYVATKGDSAASVGDAGRVGDCGAILGEGSDD